MYLISFICNKSIPLLLKQFLTFQSCFQLFGLILEPIIRGCLHGNFSIILSTENMSLQVSNWAKSVNFFVFAYTKSYLYLISPKFHLIYSPSLRSHFHFTNSASLKRNHYETSKNIH